MPPLTSIYQLRIGVTYRVIYNGRMFEKKMTFQGFNGPDHATLLDQDGMTHLVSNNMINSSDNPIIIIPP